jgi:membrane-bound metal-dependent hydrolase YbcI (DUF457 family)
VHAPLFSTVTLVAELFVSAIVYYTFYRGYKDDKFPEKLAIGAIVYEALFDIGYMVHRVPAQENKLNKPLVIALGATHGILSLLMFLGLILFFVFAIKNYRKGVNYFKVHKKLTFVFLFFWTLSIISGVSLYFVAY